MINHERACGIYQDRPLPSWREIGVFHLTMRFGHNRVLSRLVPKRPAVQAGSEGKLRRDGLDQIRALAILYVLAVHTFGFWFAGGGAGVGVFFALSGYLTAGRLLAEPRLDIYAVSVFLMRRVTRIYPAFVVVMFAIWLIICRWVPDRQGYFVDAVPGLIAFWRPLNWEPLGIGVGILWSLRVEVQFYLLLPLAMLLLGQRRGLLATSAILCVTSPIMAGIGMYAARGESVFYCGAGMALGSLLAYLERYHRPLLDHREWKHGWTIGLVVLLVLLFVPQIGPRIWWSELTLAALATCAMIAALIHRPDWPVLPYSAWIGRLAFCLYLIHGPVIDWIRPVLGLSMWGKILIFIPLTMLLSLVLHHGIEKPMIRWGNRMANMIDQARTGSKKSFAGISDSK
jgi:peptidoglycan/LPS O-acetylase OafA/YrhL